MERTMGVRGYKPFAPLTDAEERQGVSDVLCAAFEGGSNYWMSAIRKAPGDQPPTDYLSELPSAGGTVVVVEDRTEEGEKPLGHRLSYAKALRGCKEAADFLGLSLRAFFDDHDANSADIALQFAVLEEVVYG